MIYQFLLSTAFALTNLEALEALRKHIAEQTNFKPLLHRVEASLSWAKKNKIKPSMRKLENKNVVGMIKAQKRAIDTRSVWEFQFDGLRTNSYSALVDAQTGEVLKLSEIPMLD